MEADVGEFARLSAEAYNVGQQTDVGKWRFDPVISNSSTSVYWNPDLKQVAFAHRGTNPKSVRDHLQNGLLALGRPWWGNRLKRSERAVVNGMAKYAGSQFIHTGHSAGGTSALLLGSKYGHSGHVFNPGMSPWDRSMKIDDKLTVHHTIGDPISSMLHAPESYLRKNVKLYAPSSKNPHSLSNFLNPRPINTGLVKRLRYF